jgi:hypothetical protein
MRLTTLSRFLSFGHEFRLLWIAQSTSAIGTQISQVALPLFAVSYLGLSPLGVGILLAMEGIPPVALGLFAGILVDRADL